MSISFSIKKFDELSSIDIYYILQARSQVFIVEQQCVYQDIDDIDFDCLHLVAHKDQALVGYCRIVPPNILNTVSAAGSNNHPQIGRVLVLPEHRNNGLARQIMNKAIKYCRTKYKNQPIQISAQTYLTNFYQSLGFSSIGFPYLQDGLEHVDMILKTNKKKTVALPGIANGISAKSVIINTLLLFLAIAIIGLLYLLI